MLRLLTIVALVLGFGLGMAPAPGWASGAASKGGPKIPATYVAVPKLRLAVQVDENRQYRMLELEAWLSFKTPEEAAAVNSRKAVVAEEMKTAFLGYNLEAFSDPVEGIDLAKSIIRDCVAKAVPGAAAPDDVLIKEMLLR